MFQTERHERILDHLAEHELLTLQDAIDMLGASPATVRRDFERLAARNVVDRIRGGVRQIKRVAGDMEPFALREVRQAHEKEAIARKAVELLKPGDVVTIDGGTTTFFLSQHLPDMPVRVITNSLRLATALEERRARHPQLEIYLTGGFLYPQSGLLLGPSSQTSLSQYHANWAFLSVGGITARGISNTNELVVDTERIMIEHADHIAILADHTKIGRHAMCHVCGLERLDYLITDAGENTETALAPLREAGLRITTVNPNGDD